MKINSKILGGAFLVVLFAVGFYVARPITTLPSGGKTETQADTTEVPSQNTVTPLPDSSLGAKVPGPTQEVKKPSATTSGQTTTSATLPPVTPVTPVPQGGPVVFRKIVIGVVVNESEVSEDVKEHTPLARYLANKLAGSETLGSVRVSKSIIEMSELVRRGEVDLYIDTPFTAAIIQKLSAGTIFATRAKGGVETYQSYIFVRKDSGLTSLTDLVGKKIVFESADSTTNYFLPKVVLLQAGLKLSLINSDGTVPPGTVGYYFVGDDAIIIPDVFRRKADAGGRNSVSYIKETSTVGGEFLILAKSPKVYRSVVVASPKLSPTHVNVIKEALISMDSSEEGRIALQQSGKTLYFRAISLTSPEALAMQSLSAYVDDEIIKSNIRPQ